MMRPVVPLRIHADRSPGGWMLRSPWRAMTSSPTASRRPSRVVTDWLDVDGAVGDEDGLGELVEEPSLPIPAVDHRMGLAGLAVLVPASEHRGVGVGVTVGQHQLTGRHEFVERLG